MQTVMLFPQGHNSLLFGLHIGHRLLRLLCSHIDAPLHSTQFSFIFPHLHRLEPEQLLHLSLRRGVSL